ncbi:MAG: hypothetical protein WC860_09950, partial [Candidatus Margulisiibacteriota bacterium]
MFKRQALITFIIFFTLVTICLAANKFPDSFYKNTSADAISAVNESKNSDNNLRYAMIYFKENDYKKASEYLLQYKPDKAYKRNYRNYLLVQIAIKENQLDLEQIYNKYKIQDPFLEEQLFFEIAENYYSNNELSKSEVLFCKVSNNSVETELDQKSLQRLFEINQKRNDLAKSKKYLSELLIRYPNSLDYLKEVGSSPINLFMPEDFFESANDYFLFCQNLYKQ